MSCWMTPTFKPESFKIRVVLPVCIKDYDLMMENLEWQCQLDGRKDYDCVLAIDGQVSPSEIRNLEIKSWRTFSEVQTYVYPTAPNPAWPNGPNWAFQHVAKHMQAGRRSWFWMEADCIPLRPLWLTMLNQEYSVCGKPIMGAIVEGMGHCNGTAIYPANFPALSKRAMQCTDIAWDGEMKQETIKLTHNAIHIMCHVWGIKNGRARPYGGDAAHFDTWKHVERWVCPYAAVFHRAKDKSLIDRLREKYQ